MPLDLIRGWPRPSAWHRWLLDTRKGRLKPTPPRRSVFVGLFDPRRCRVERNAGRHLRNARREILNPRDARAARGGNPSRDAPSPGEETRSSMGKRLSFSEDGGDLLRLSSGDGGNRIPPQRVPVAASKTAFPVCRERQRLLQARDPSTSGAHDHRSTADSRTARQRQCV